jgi:hypothetical protein
MSSSSAQPSLNMTIEPDDYEVSNDCMEDSPYLTQTAKNVMRSISYVSSSDSENDENEDENNISSDSDNDDDNNNAIPANNNDEDNSSDDE